MKLHDCSDPLEAWPRCKEAKVTLRYRTQVWTPGQGWFDADWNWKLKARANHHWTPGDYVIDFDSSFSDGGVSIYHLGICYSESRVWEGREKASMKVKEYANSVCKELKPVAKELLLEAQRFIFELPDL